MASVHYLCIEGFKIPFKIRQQYSIHEGDLRKRQWAAVKIQKVWRGYQTREALKKLNEAATTIQRFVRGWLVRWHLPTIYQEYLNWRAWKHYNDAATNIQAWWKGMKIRQYGKNLKEALEQRKIWQKNSIVMRDSLKRMFDKQECKKSGDNISVEQVQELEEESKKNVLFILYKLHHLLRTTVSEGIYSNHGTTELSYVEQMFKTLKFKSYMTDLRMIYNNLHDASSTTKSPIFKNKKLAKLERLHRMRDPSRDIKEAPLQEPTFTNKKSFNLYSRAEEPKYQKSIMYPDKYEPPRDLLSRKVNKSKHISKTSFDLYVYQKPNIKPKTQPYHINFWQDTKCDIHNCSKIFH